MFKWSNVGYARYRTNDQIHTDFSLGYDTHHFIPSNQSISLKSLLNDGPKGLVEVKFIIPFKSKKI